MKTVFIFHGTAGHPGENWFPWLKGKLEGLGMEVIVPQFPTPQGQSYEAWMEVFKPYMDKVTPETIMVAHSLGGEFLLKFLENNDVKIKAAAFVGTPIGELPLIRFETHAAFIGGFNFDWEKIKSRAKHFIVYHSDTDPYVGLQNGKALAEHLGTQLTFIPKAGHFNQAAGYTTFEHLFNQLRSLG